MEQENIQTSIPFNQTKPLICRQCNNETFIQSFLMRSIPAIIIGENQDGLSPYPVWECTACGNVLPESIPGQLLEIMKQEKNKENGKSTDIHLP